MKNYLTRDEQGRLIYTCNFDETSLWGDERKDGKATFVFEEGEDEGEYYVRNEEQTLGQKLDVAEANGYIEDDRRMAQNRKNYENRKESIANEAGESKRPISIYLKKPTHNYRLFIEDIEKPTPEKVLEALEDCEKESMEGADDFINDVTIEEELRDEEEETNDNLETWSITIYSENFVDGGTAED